MQIKERGDKYQLLRYAGYSKDKKRATVEVAGNISKLAREIPADLAAKLETDEIEQLTAFLKEKAEASDIRSANASVLLIANKLLEAQHAIERGVEIRDADAIDKAIKSFQKAMKKALKKPKGTKVENPPSQPEAKSKQVEADPRQQALTLPEASDPAATTS